MSALFARVDAQPPAVNVASYVGHGSVRSAVMGADFRRSATPAEIERMKLYEQQKHHLFCPCHQSTFDAANGAKVLFGPAARNLPQLAISVDAEGYFVAQGDFNEPVGPSFWERKDSYPDKAGT